MNAKYLLLAAGLLAGCAPTPEEKAEAAIHKEFAELMTPPRKYEPISIRSIERPARAENINVPLRWFANHYVLTDSAGKKTERVDTVAVMNDGTVTFY